MYCQVRVPSSAVPLSSRAALRQTLREIISGEFGRVYCVLVTAVCFRRKIMAVSVCVCVRLRLSVLRGSLSVKRGFHVFFPFCAESCLLRFIDWNCDFSELRTLAGTDSGMAVMLDLLWSRRFLNVWWSVYSLFKLWGADVMAWSKQKPGHTVVRGFGLSLWPRHTSFFSSSEISFEHVPPPPHLSFSLCWSAGVIHNSSG